MPTLHLVSHTHWDREWYRTFQQFRMKLAHLIDHLLDILENDPSYRYFMLDGQTIVLEDYLAIRPEREEILRQYIQDGRILIGPWYILPDEFLVSPEATIRNLLEGERICRRYGRKMMIGYIPDSFGHIGQMPQILRGFGIDSASVMRGLALEPCEFWWESADGSQVLMAYLRNGYSNAAGILSANLDRFVNEAKRQRDDLAPHSRAQHLLFMHGTDHMEPQSATAQAIHYSQEKLGESHLVHSTLPRYIECLKSTILEKDLPVITGELRSSQRFPLLPAVLSTRMWIKQRNRVCENLLEQWAEPFSAWAECLPGKGLPETAVRQPVMFLREAWLMLMLCHPHDSICGCSIDQVHEEMRARFDQVEQIGEEITNQSLAALAAEINTCAQPAAVSAVVVFNPSSITRTGQVQAELVGIPDNSSFELVDENQKSIACEMLGLGSGELINLLMERSEFRDGFAMVADGIVMGLRIRQFRTSREGDQVRVEMVLQEKGEPDLVIWEQGRQVVEGYLADPKIMSYHVRARTASAAKVAFAAVNIPPHGYRVFWVLPKPIAEKPQTKINPLMKPFLPLVSRLGKNPQVQNAIKRFVPDSSAKPPFWIENEFFLVKVETDGSLSVQEKRSGKWFYGQNRFVDGGDRGDEYNYSPPEVDQVCTAVWRSARVTRSGVEEVIYLSYELTIPECLAPGRKERAARKTLLPINCRVSLTPGLPRIDFHTEVDNRAEDHRLRVHFSAPFAVEDGEYDGHFEIVRRPLKLPESDENWVEQPRPEVPQRAFTHISSDDAGLVVANRGLPEVEILRGNGQQSEIGLTLLRCVGWLSRDDFPERKGHAGPYMETPGAQLPGNWAFDYALAPYAGGRRMEAIQQGYAFQTELRSISAEIHPGQFESCASFLKVSPDAFVISAVKLAQNGRGWVVRGYNLGDSEISVEMTLARPFREAVQTNLAEEETGLVEQRGPNAVRFIVKGHEIATILFRMPSQRKIDR